MRTRDTVTKRDRNGVAQQYLYTNFAGIDTSRADIASEKLDAQPLSSMDNMYCDWRGFLTNERAITPILTERLPITHMRWFSQRENDIIYAARSGNGTSLRSLLSPTQNVEEIWGRDAVVGSSVFNRRITLTAAQEQPIVYDGFGFRQNYSPYAYGARYSAVVQDRLALAGFDDNPNEIRLSRVNMEDTMPEDEEPGETSPIKAFRFNVENLISTADYVTGIAEFESNRFAVFTTDRTIVYVANVEYTLWAVDDKVTINVGCISHNTIQLAGSDLLFCSRSGVHALKRSALNGTTMFSIPLSSQVKELYAWLVAQVRDPETISATFDQDEGRYHVFFPANERLVYRLSLAVNPQTREDDTTMGRWSMSTFAGLTCGDFLSGRMAFGSISGFQRMEHESTEGVRGEGSAVFPILWHGDFMDPKFSGQLVLYAAGAGRVTVSGEDEAGRQLGNVIFDLPEEGRCDFMGVPLPAQFTRPFSYQYTGLRLRVKIEGDNQVRIFAIGVKLKEI